MKLGRLVAVAIALIVILVRWLTDSEREADSGKSTAQAGKYVATVQEGLGASVAILLDNSGSMDDEPESGGGSTKARISRLVLEQVLAQTDSFVQRQPGFPVNVGLYVFSSDVERVLPIAPYDRTRLRDALASLREPDGGTAIGDAIDAAVPDLYGAGTIRKYILVVTDGENTEGRNPARVAAEVDRRSEGAVRLMLVAFDVDGEKFGFVPAVRGTLVEATNAAGLAASLDTLYRGRILAEALDAGETLADSARKP
ncbi:MAG: VWA domain-containing protein [Gemmatimonadota bacterium]